MNENDVKTIFDNTFIPKKGYNLTFADNCYWGRSVEGYFVFAKDVDDPNIEKIIQNTKYLQLYLNTECLITNEDKTVFKRLSLLILKSTDVKHVEIFSRITFSFRDNNDNKLFLKYFLSLKDLFANEQKVSTSELQGLYGELYSLYFFKKTYDIDIAKYYQSEGKRKFDFSITDKKKIDIKSTLKPTRVHHFLKEQLNTERYDIRIISLLFQKDDMGLSLYELIEKCKEFFKNQLSVILHIENMVNNLNNDEISRIRYNENYLETNIKIFDAVNIPKIKEKNDEGVFNVEFDSDLTNASSVDSCDFIKWINEQ